MDAAIAVVKTWPPLDLPGVAVEIRPMVKDYSPVRVVTHPADARPTDDLLARTLREEAGPLVARLSRRFGDFDLAEEAVQGAVVEALTVVAPGRPAGATRPRGSRSPRPATPWTGCGSATASGRSPRGPAPGAGDRGRRPGPTTGSPCCSPAATLRWRPRRGWR